MTSSKNVPPSFSYYDLLNACTQTGCPICRVGAHAVKRHLKSLFNEYVNDTEARDSILRSLGFCKEHVQLLLNTRIADALGASIIYENIIKKILREFPRDPASFPSNPKERARTISKFISASDGLGECVACEQRETAFDRVIHDLSSALDQEELQVALQGSDGLCLPHLSQLFERVQKQEDLNFLINLIRNKLETRQFEMSELIRKNDHYFRSEGISQAEALAWKNAMCTLSGVSISPTGDKHD